MARKGRAPEQIIAILREAEVAWAQGKTVGEFCRGREISEQTDCRWRNEYGGLKVDQARKLKAQEKENSRLKKAVAELPLDKLSLQEAGNF